MWLSDLCGSNIEDVAREAGSIDLETNLLQGMTRGYLVYASYRMWNGVPLVIFRDNMWLLMLTDLWFADLRMELELLSSSDETTDIYSPLLEMVQVGSRNSLARFEFKNIWSNHLLYTYMCDYRLSMHVMTWPASQKFTCVWGWGATCRLC